MSFRACDSRTTNDASVTGHKVMLHSAVNLPWRCPCRRRASRSALKNASRFSLIVPSRTCARNGICKFCRCRIWDRSSKRQICRFLHRPSPSLKQPTGIGQGFERILDLCEDHLPIPLITEDRAAQINRACTCTWTTWLLALLPPETEPPI